MGVASPSYSLSTPAMIFSSVDLPDPFRPITPILAPGKKDRETPLRMWRFGGTILPRRFMVKTYWAIVFWIRGAVQPSIIAGWPCPRGTMDVPGAAEWPESPAHALRQLLGLAVDAVLQRGLGHLVQRVIDHVA